MPASLSQQPAESSLPNRKGGAVVEFVEAVAWRQQESAVVPTPPLPHSRIHVSPVPLHPPHPTVTPLSPCCHASMQCQVFLQAGR